MLAIAKSCSIYGIDSFLVDVEVDISTGLPAFDIVGLPDIAVKESRERVRAAIKNQNLNFPIKRITVNLAPADIKKEGPHFDLPIALGILAAMEQVPLDLLREYVVVGELSLDGSLRPVNGILPMAIEVKERKLKGMILPLENAEEASVIQGIKVVGIQTLREAVEFLSGDLEHNLSIQKPNRSENNFSLYKGDFAEVKGQENLKRCLEIAAAGHHNVLMIGPPGSGKTMIARRIPTILPSMTFEESLELTKIYSISGLIEANMGLIKNRPFRAPHHSISSTGLAGGGRIPKPGEVTLAHHGVLFLDEFPEFPRDVLEFLRQPMEDEKITIARVSATITYPAKFMLVAAMNPCPCGYYGDPFHECSCASYQIQRYMSKISGPLIDRIDIQVDAAPIKFADLEKTEAVDSATIRNRVEIARNIQNKRYKEDNIYCNSQLTPKLIGKYCKLNKRSKQLMKEAFERLRLSARAYGRILKVSRTIADLDQKPDIEENHLAEALRYRSIDKYYQNLR